MFTVLIVTNKTFLRFLIYNVVLGYVLEHAIISLNTV